MMDDYEEMEKVDKECDSIIASMAIIVFVIYAVLLAFGIVYFTSCPDTRIAIYSVLQGLTVMFNSAMFTTCLLRKWVGRRMLFLIGSPILLFNLGWSIQGALWLYFTDCPTSVLYWYAVGTSIPLWVIVGLYCLSCWCCRTGIY